MTYCHVTHFEFPVIHLSFVIRISVSTNYAKC